MKAMTIAAARRRGKVVILTGPSLMTAMVKREKAFESLVSGVFSPLVCKIALCAAALLMWVAKAVAVDDAQALAWSAGCLLMCLPWALVMAKRFLKGGEK